MFHKVATVKPIENFFLLVSFKNGENKKYDGRAQKLTKPPPSFIIVFDKNSGEVE